MPLLVDEIDWHKAELKKISIRIDGHATSVSLEQAYIDILVQKAEQSQLSFAALVTFIDENRPPNINLSAALRIFALKLAQNLEVSS